MDYKEMKPVQSETPDYSDVLQKLKEMKRKEDEIEVVVMTKLRRLSDGN